MAAINQRTREGLFKSPFFPRDTYRNPLNSVRARFLDRVRERIGLQTKIVEPLFQPSRLNPPIRIDEWGSLMLGRDKDSGYLWGDMMLFERALSFVLAVIRSLTPFPGCTNYQCYNAYRCNPRRQVEAKGYLQ